MQIKIHDSMRPLFVTKNVIQTVNDLTKNNLKLKYIKHGLRRFYPNKPQYDSVIPLNIFQTWHTHNLPPLMKESVNLIKRLNPGFQHFLFDDNDCRNFIIENYPPDVLYAFDNLIPGAYKADLWRYCVLYKLGGIYLDIKYRPVNYFRFISLTEKEHFVLDADKYGIYNALLVCKPGNQILFKAIRQIVENVKRKYYGNHCLDPTGPKLLAKYFTNRDKQRFEMRHEYYNNNNNRFVFFKNYVVLKSYHGYLNEHNANKKIQHYGVLWEQRKIYK